MLRIYIPRNKNSYRRGFRCPAYLDYKSPTAGRSPASRRSPVVRPSPRSRPSKSASRLVARPRRKTKRTRTASVYAPSTRQASQPTTVALRFGTVWPSQTRQATSRSGIPSLRLRMASRMTQLTLWANSSALRTWRLATRTNGALLAEISARAMERTMSHRPRYSLRKIAFSIST